MSIPRQGLLLTDGLRRLASMLGVKTDHAEDALHSERAAQTALSRRNLFAAAGALAAGTAFSFPVPEKLPVIGAVWTYDWYMTATDWILLDEQHNRILTAKRSETVFPCVVVGSTA